MEQARQHCQKENSDLVSITTEAESILLWNVVSRITCQTNAHNKAAGFLLSLCVLLFIQISKYEKLFWIGLTVDLDKTAV